MARPFTDRPGPGTSGDHFASFEERSDLVVELCRRGLAGRMVLSHDTCSDVLPYLRNQGVPDQDIHAMLVRNLAQILCG